MISETLTFFLSDTTLSAYICAELNLFNLLEKQPTKNSQKEIKQNKQTNHPAIQATNRTRKALKDAEIPLKFSKLPLARNIRTFFS